MNDAPLLRIADARRFTGFDALPLDDTRLAGTLNSPRVRTVALLLLLVAVAVLARFQTFGNPVLEYDEQFYRFVGEQMLHGQLPYVDVWDRKPIGLFLIYAAAAGLWGETALAYQAMALLFVVATAWTMYAMAQRLSRSRFTPFAVAILYIFWLNLLEGTGGQTPVFYLLPICLAASLVLRSFAQPWIEQRRLILRGWAVAALIGLAVQIKYTVVLESGYFLLAMLWLLHRAGMRYPHLAFTAAGWGAAVVAPTALAGLFYLALGHGQEWWFANFQSVLLRKPLHTDLSDVAGALAAMVPLFVIAGWSLSRMPRLRTQTRFVIGWAAAALLAIIALWSFLPHYWMPLPPPTLLLCIVAFDRVRALALGVLLAAGVAAQIVVAHSIWLHGDQRNYDNMIAAMGPGPHCIFMFEGFPALNGASSCMLTRFTFPGHLNAGWEADALGIDTVKEVKRVMRQRPQFVVRTSPFWEFGNREASAALMAVLERDYHVIHVERTGRRWLKLIYALRESGTQAAARPETRASRRSPDAT